MLELYRAHFFNSALMLLLLLFLLPGCASQRIVDWPPIEGRILEEGTGKPIEDAIVVALWKGVAPFTTTVCLHVESTTTDDAGRYVVPAWRNEGKWNNLDSQYVGIYAYKAGYEPNGSSGKFANVYTEREFNKTQSEWISGPGRVDKAMSNFLGTKEERLNYLSSMAVSCSHIKEIEAALLPLYKALYKEAERIALSKEQKLKALYRLRDIERVELGTDVAWEKFRERMKKLQ